MQTKKRDLFTTIQVEGAILPPDLLQRLVSAKDVDGLNPQSFHLLPNEKVNEAINRAWNRLLGAWQSFSTQRNKLPHEDLGTTLTRERWLLQIFSELGYGRLQPSKRFVLENKEYSISHTWRHVPIHLLGFKIDLDRRTKGVAGAASASPHSLLQEFLNRSDDHLWGFLSNGLKLRILRDNVSLTRQAYVEFDLEAMMEGEVYADFVLLWILGHQSRVEADKPEECWLERWSQSAQEQGTRALDQLRKGVEETITALGSGFLNYPGNNGLREKLRSGALDKQDYYRQLLRLVYRLIFLFTAEDRNLLLTPEAPDGAKEIYTRYYSTMRFRRLAQRQRGTRNSDLYRGLKLVMQKLSDPDGCPELALPALGSFLFSDATIPHLEQSDIRNHDFLDAIRALAFIQDGGVRRPVDFKNTGSEELGSIYESLLELHPELSTEGGSFELKTAGGHERKTTGSYYTPTSLIRELLNSALDPVLDEALKNADPEKAILDLKICDPACGSGHFLIAAAHRMARKLAFARTGDEEAAPEENRKALRDIIGHCIYGVDINEMSVELCKVGLWMEALEPGKPLSFLDHRILCGNSLLGTTPALINKGIPDDAFKPIEGDNRAYCSEYKKRNKQERERGQKSLFHEPGLWFRYGNLSDTVQDIDTLPDDSFEAVSRKSFLFNEHRSSDDYILNKLIADTWCAAFVWKKSKQFDYPITHEVFRRVQERPAVIPDWLDEEINRLADQYSFFHWHIEFPDVFHVPGTGEQADNKETGWIGGFDVVLGNPPWERIKLQEKEWFATRRPDIADAPNAARRREMIAELQTEDPTLYRAFLEDRRKAEGESHFVRDSGLYALTGRGDVNTYALFAEAKRTIINPTGRVGCIVPSGIATDDTTKFFFQDLMEKAMLHSLYDFENRRAIFQGVHRSYKFCLLTMSGIKRPARQGADFVFFAQGTEELRDSEKHFTLTAEDIELLNPNTKTCPIFRSKRDAELTKSIYRRVPVLIKEDDPDGNPWGIKFVRMFDMSNDSHLFRTREQLEEDGWELRGNVFCKGDEKYLPLYEAKMMHQFDHRYATYSDNGETRLITLTEHQDESFLPIPNYWVNQTEISQIEKDWLLSYRRFGPSTNERSIIAKFCPKLGLGDSEFIINTDKNSQLECCLLQNLNTFVFDYLARTKIGGTNINFYLLRQLPAITPASYSVQHLNMVCDRVIELSYTAYDIKPLAKECGFSSYPFVWDEERRFLIRCELDAAYFHLYGIERDDVDYIMETFPIVKRKDIAAHGEYRTKRVILEIYDEMAEAMRTGQPYQTRLDPPPGDPRAAHRGEGE